MSSAKELRYHVMLALYFPILLYAVSTFDIERDTYAVEEYEAVAIGEPTVLLGQQFEARAFLAASTLRAVSNDTSRVIRPRLSAEGDLLAKGDSLLTMNTGELLASDEDQATVTYEAAFEAPQIGGSVTRFPVRGSFTVRRPEIVATSEVTQTLYRHCLNRVRISVPGLENRPLRLETGGRTVEGQSIGLAPGGDQTSVRVLMEQPGGGEPVYLGSKQFNVTAPPRPTIEVQNAGREITNGDRLPKRRASLTFQVEPDQEFQRQYPDDARYQVQSATVFLRRGLTASQEVGTFEVENNRIVLTEELRDASPGDQLMVQLEGIVRINHQNRAIPVDLPEGSRMFGFILS